MVMVKLGLGLGLGLESTVRSRIGSMVRVKFMVKCWVRLRVMFKVGIRC